MACRKVVVATHSSRRSDNNEVFRGVPRRLWQASTCRACLRGITISTCIRNFVGERPSRGDGGEYLSRRSLGRRGRQSGPRKCEGPRHHPDDGLITMRGPAIACVHVKCDAVDSRSNGTSAVLWRTFRSEASISHNEDLFENTWHLQHLSSLHLSIGEVAR